MLPGLHTYDTVDWGKPVSSHPLNRGLAAWFLSVPQRFRVGSLQWQDVTRAHIGVLTNSPVWGRSPERPGGRLSLNATSGTSYVQVPHATRLNLSESASTIAFWVRSPFVAADFSAWLDKGEGDAGNAHAWSIRASTVSADGRVTILLEDGSATSVGAVFLNAIWCYLVITWDGTNIHFYRNGAFLESVSQPSGTFRSSDTNTFNINALRASGAVLARSGTRLDDIRLYDNRVLSAGEIAELYRKSCRGNANLLNRWRLHRGSSQEEAAAVRGNIIGAGIGGGAAYILGG